MGQGRGRAVQLVIGAAWAVAIGALIVVVISCGALVIRRFIRLLRALGELLSSPAVLEGVKQPEPEVRPIPSVLEPVAFARERRDAFRAIGAQRKQLRAQRRHERGLDLIAPWRTH